jgi:hypothetical protein
MFNIPQVFSRLQRKRFINRNMFYIFLAAFFFMSGFFVHSAFAVEPSKTLRATQTVSKRIVTTTTTIIPTTTTTTTQPVITTTTKPYVPPITQPVVETIQADWVTQCHLWAGEAGIELPPSAISLIDEESDCDPNVKNPSSSACGIAQNIRGCDSPGYGRDPVQQLKWMHGYVFGKFGGWEQALAFWHCKGTCYFKGGSIYKTANWY